MEVGLLAVRRGDRSPLCRNRRAAQTQPREFGPAKGRREPSPRGAGGGERGCLERSFSLGCGFTPICLAVPQAPGTFVILRQLSGSAEFWVRGLPSPNPQTLCVLDPRVLLLWTAGAGSVGLLHHRAGGLQHQLRSVARRPGRIGRGRRRAERRIPADGQLFLLSLTLPRIWLTRLRGTGGAGVPVLRLDRG